MRKLMIIFFCTLVLSAGGLVQAQTPNYNIRVFGYLNTWALQMGAGVWGSSNYENMLYTNLDRSACTDYITFNANFNTDGSMKMASDWYPSTGNTAWGQAYFQVPKRRFLNDWIHTTGQRVHICFFVGGDGAEWTAELASPTIRTAMIVTIRDSCIGTTNRYDGVVFDVEPLGTGDTANVRLFLKELRDTLNNYHQWADVSKKPEISICFFDQWNQSTYWAKVAAYVDNFQHMSYNMMGNWETISWYNEPVYSTGYTGNPPNVSSIDSYTAEFIANGIPRNKLVMASSFNYNAFQGGSTAGGEGCYAPLLTMTTYPTAMLYNTSGALVGYWSGSEDYYCLWNGFLDTSTTTHAYDATRQAAWGGVNVAGNTNDFIVIYQDTTTIKKILDYASAQGLMGTMIWDLCGGYVNSPNQTRHPGLVADHLLQAVKQERLVLASSTVSNRKYLFRK